MSQGAKPTPPPLRNETLRGRRRDARGAQLREGAAAERGVRRGLSYQAGFARAVEQAEADAFSGGYVVKYFCRWVSQYPTRHVIESVEFFEERPEIGTERKTDGRTYRLAYTRPDRKKDLGGAGVIRCEKREVREAFAYASEGGQALHVWTPTEAERKRAHPAFRRHRLWAHLIDYDADRLRTTAEDLGVNVIVVERLGRRGQHVDLCGAPLRRALSRVQLKREGGTDGQWDESNWYDDEECPECGRRWKEAGEDAAGDVRLECRAGHEWRVQKTRQGSEGKR